MQLIVVYPRLMFIIALSRCELSQNAGESSEI